MNTQLKLNIIQRFARKIIIHSKTSFIIPIITKLYNKNNSYEESLSSLPSGTVGRSVAELLQKHNLKLIPNYEDHDFKHVLLNYDMTPEDEVKMQFFLFGNGNHSLSCLSFLWYGLLLPELWSDLYTEYQNGKQYIPIHHLKLKNMAHWNLEELRQEIALPAGDLTLANY